MKFTSSYDPKNYEADIYEGWESSGVFNPKPLKSNFSPKTPSGVSNASDFSISLKNRPYYSIVMPPPNANGNLHIGHGLTIALEDSLTRFYRLLGKSTWFIPGADHAGFETWVVYERALESLGHSRFEYTRDELYSRVWDFVQEQRGNMELQLRALGASCAWDDLTFTLDENVVSRVYKTFEKMWNDGYIYRGEKLVNYCPKHQTAFADIEVEHVDEPGFLYDIKYELTKEQDEEQTNSFLSHKEDSQNSRRSYAREQSVAGASRTALRTSRLASERILPESSRDKKEVSRSSSPSYVVVSTTRPETLFGDQAVAVNPSDPRYKDIIGKKVKLPLTNREIPIIADEHADPEYGTGAVKINPAHDYDDYEVGKRHNLENLRVISNEAVMLPVCGERYSDLTTEECRALVLKDLEDQGLLLGSHKITHSVAHCYKCGTIIEPTLKEQWFVDTEKLAKTAISALEQNQILFHPASKQKILINYLKNLKDWNISRQIPWGIPIPMFKKSALVSKGTGKKNYDSAPEWIFDTRTNLKQIEIGGVLYERDEDTFDTWFSSSHWPIVCTDWTEDNGSPFYPLNVMETGADILFAWVARMIMMGLYITNEVPFKEVYLHGLVLDAHGKKMSKSKGNVINPMDLVSKYGSDAFRLGILRGRSAGMSQAFSEESVISGRNLCNKLWNLARLIQSWVDEADNDGSKNLASGRGELVSSRRRPQATAEDKEADTRDGGLAELRSSKETKSSSPRSERGLSSAPYTTLNMGEDWICREMNLLREKTEKNLTNYRFAEAAEDVYSTIWDKYADWFCESQKLYKNLPLIKRTFEDLLIISHPFMPFVTETIWQTLSWTSGMLITQTWPKAYVFDPISAEQFERLKTAVQEIRRVLAALRGGKHPLKSNPPLLFGDDSLIADNSALVCALSKCPSASPAEGEPRGIRLALSGREIYLDTTKEITASYRETLEDRILSVGRELDALEARMMNPNYVDKAPSHLVEETRKGIEEKKGLIARLKNELTVIK